MPVASSSSAWVPVSTIRPAAMTTMRLARSMVESRCATTSVVRPAISASSPCWTFLSLSVSSALVASSRIRIGAFLSSARAIATRWRWPPDSITPFSPTIVE